MKGIMKKNGWMILVWIAVVATMAVSCTENPKITKPLPTGSSSITGPGGSVPAAVAVTATPNLLTFNGTASVQATVTDSGGANVSDGTIVIFIVNNTALGLITPQATTFNGIATATFTAGTNAGTVTVTATSGAVNNTATITINAPTTGSIEFVSATPSVIGIRGSGQTETSLITFAVKDVNGNPVVDGIAVSFTMSGPGGGRLPASGGEYIGLLDTTPTTGGASTVGGDATVTLNSGTVAGPVTIIASVTLGAQTLSSASTPISIGGGVPSATHFNIATSRFNLDGFDSSNVQATLSAFIADRFGNFNVLTGTSVSFYTEAGAVDASNITNNTGITSVLFRTQAPMPASVAIWGPADPLDEVALLTYLNGTYGLGLSTTEPTVHPRHGWVAVLAAVQGEEHFNDANGNGLYDAGETFTDLGEPFYDKNDDGCRNNGATKNCSGVVSASPDPFEEFIDANGNNIYDPPNGVWDGPGCPGAGCQTSKMIWTEITLAFTGNAAFCSFDTAAPGFNIANGSSQSFSFMVGDFNTNRLVPGTTITVAASKGNLTGTTNYTVPDGVPFGPVEIGLTLSDSDSTTALAESSTITVTVNSSEVVGCATSVSGTVN